MIRLLTLVVMASLGLAQQTPQFHATGDGV
jgi:hypothetical protein